MDGQSLGLTEFFGIRVPPKKAISIGTTPGPEDDSLDTIHLSQVALGPDAKNGRHVVWVEFSATKSVIGSLTLGGIEQFQIDFPVNRELTISHSGSSDVYLTGYTTHQFLTMDSDSSGLSESEEDEGTDDDAEEMLNGPKLRRAGARMIELPVGDDYEEEEYVENGAAEGDTDSEEQSDDDEDDDGDGEEISEDNVAVPFPKLRGSKAHTFDMDDDEDDGAPAFLPLADTPSGGLHPPMDSDETDDSASDSGYEEDEEDEATDGDEEPVVQVTSSKEAKRKAASIPGSDPKAAKKARAKKAAAIEIDAEVPSVPRPAKKAKAEQPAAASTPGAAGSLSQGAVAEYQKSLNSFLKSKGPTKMAVIGSEVKRAPGLPKLKKFVTDRQETYQLDEVTGILSLR